MRAGAPVVTAPLGPIGHSLDLVGFVETGEPGEPTSAVQYAVCGPTGRHLVFGDQEFVRSGEALEMFAHKGMIRRRTITIVYGDWEDV